MVYIGRAVPTYLYYIIDRSTMICTKSFLCSMLMYVSFKLNKGIYDNFMKCLHYLNEKIYWSG